MGRAASLSGRVAPPAARRTHSWGVLGSDRPDSVPCKHQVLVHGSTGGGVAAEVAAVFEETSSVHTHGWPPRHARTHLASAWLTASLWVVSRLSSMRAAPLSVASSAPGEVKWRPPGVYGPLSRDAERAGTTMFVTSRSSIVGRRHRGRRKEVCRRSGTLPCHQSSQQPHSRWAPRPGCPCPPRGRQRGGTACCRLQGHEGKLPWRGACAPPPCCPGLRST